jgi:hypothetical protein
MNDQTRMALWDGNKNASGSENFVIDTWRHRNMAYGSQGGGAQMGGGGMDSLMDQNRTGDFGTRSLGAMSGMGGSGSNMVNLGNLHLSQGSGMSSLPLDAHPSSSLTMQRSYAELSDRRRDAIKAAFRRVDPRGQGFTTSQDLTRSLQQYTNLGPADQNKLLQGIMGNNPNRITLSQFLSYYQVLGGTIERDRDFEDLIRHHWGFPEVCDILDDMKNKFMMVGLAYTFRRGLEQGVPELSSTAFQSAISQVGMQYSDQDVRRVFDAFDASGNPSSTLEVMKLTAHLTSAPKPPAPMPALYGTAHFSEVNSQAGTPQRHTRSLDYGGLPPHTPMSYSSHWSSGHQGMSAYGNYSDGYPGGSHPEPPEAPAEHKYGPDYDNPNAPPPECPPEGEDDGCLAPPETGGNPNEPPPDAPPEDDEGCMAPPEDKTDDMDGCDCPPESGGGFGARPGGGGGFGGVTQPSPFGGGGKQPGGISGHMAAAAAAGNSVPSGRRRAVTVGSTT